MKRKTLLLLLLMTIIAPLAMNAQETLTVYENGSITNGYVPIYGFYADAYLKCEFVIPDTEMDDMVGGTISEMSFYMSSPAADTWGAANFVVFLKEVNEPTIDAYSGMDGATVVYEGSIDGTSSPMTIAFSETYTYQGGNLLVGVYETQTGGYKSITYLGQTVAGASVQGYSYTSLDAVTATQRNFIPKTTFTYTPGAAVTCPRPKSLQATNVGPHSADLSWTESGDATAWQICINGDEKDPVNVTSNPYTLTGLDPETPYTIKVRANCGDEQSNWTNEISFTTEIACPAPTSLKVNRLTSTWATLSWNGFSDGYEMEYAIPGTKNRDLTLDFEDGTFGDWTTIDADGDGAVWYALLNSQTENDLPGHDGSDGHATSASYQNVALYPDNYLVSPKVALGGILTFWACAQDASWAAEHFGVAVSVAGNTSASDFTTIWEQDMTSKKSGGVSVSVKKVATDSNKEISRDGTRAQGTWYEYTVDLGAYNGMEGYVAIRHFDCTDMFRLNVDDITISDPVATDLTWIPVGGVTSPYTLTDLLPGTHYYVRVRANCGADGYSEWTMVSFTTPFGCENPTNLTVGDITATTAELNWTGYQENFNIRFRPRTAAAPGVFSDDFEGDISGWTLVDADGDGFNWVQHINTGTQNMTAHSGDGTMNSASYDNDGGMALFPDNWLISPQVPLGGSVSFWAMGQDASYAEEHFAIYVSTTGTDISDFTQISEEFIATGEYLEYTADLSDYSGNGYIAIRHFNVSDMFFLNVDDFNVYDASGVDIVEAEWELFEDVEEIPFLLENLEPDTEYEVQVQGNCSKTETTDWTDLVYFTTLPVCTAPTNVTFSEITYNSAVISWTETGTAASWQLEIIDYSAYQSTAPGTVTPITVTTNTYTVTNLNPKSNYVVYVYANCDEGEVSQPSEFAYFTTAQSPCSAPTGLTANNITDSSAEITWTPAGDATQWEIAYGTSDEVLVQQGSNYYLNEDALVPILVTAPTYTMQGLTDNTVYYVFVRSVCGDYPSSAWLDQYITFTTELAPLCPSDEMCEISYELNDSYGDGWNNNAIQVVDVETGAVLQTLTMTSGSTFSGVLAVCDGREIQFSWVAGTYASETSYVVMDAFGEEIFSGSGTLASPVSYTVNCTPPSCPKPTNLEVNYEGGTTAEVSWTSDATNFDLMLNTTVISGVTNPYTLNNLDYGTVYSVQVRANCGASGTSDWTNPVSFTTSLCDAEDMCELTFVLTDSYGDGWNGAAIQVVDVETNIVIAEMANENLDGTNGAEENTKTLAVCNGRAVNFVWKAGSYDYEASYVVYDANGDEIFSGSGAMTESVDYTVDCTVDLCKTPMDLVASNITGTSADLSWTEEGLSESFNLRFAQAVGTTATIIFTADDVWGDGSGYQFLLDADANAFGTIIPATGALTTSGDVSDEVYAEFEYKIPANADGALNTENMVSGNTVILEIPAGTYDWCITNPTPGDRMWIASAGGTVGGRYDDFEFLPGLIYEFHVYYGGANDATDLNISPSSNWETIDGISNPYTLTGLTPATSYIVQVQAVCADGMTTKWSDVLIFATEAPTDVEQELTLSVGWGWFSSYIEYPADALTIMEEGIAAGSESGLIKSQTQAVTLNEGEWGGTLTELHNESMYLILSEGGEVTLSGPLADPAAHPISISGGWNWIGYISSNAMPVSEALASITPAENDQIKTQGAYSSYDSEDGWNGALSVLEPGKGYLYLHNGGGAELVYPSSSKGGVVVPELESYWKADHHAYPTNLTMMVTLEENQIAMRKGSHEIGAFVKGECRGSARLQEVNGRYIAFLTVSGEDGEEVVFRLYDVTTGTEYAKVAEERISYQSDAVYGTMKEPMRMHFNMTGVGENDDMLSLYPNPTKDKVLVSGTAIQMIRVYNTMGQLIHAEDCGNAEQVELNLNGFSYGVYTISVLTSNGLTINKMVVKE